MSEQLQWPSRQPRAQLARPVSATHGAVTIASLLGILLSFAYLKWRDPFSDTVHRIIFIAGMTTIAVTVVDQLMRHRQRRAGLIAPVTTTRGDLGRSGIKFLGFLATLCVLAIPYLLFAEYRGNFYDRYYQALGDIAVPVLLLAFPYIYLVDRRMAQPKDGNYNMGLIVLLRLDEVDRGILRQHALAWIVKGYFLPLMFVYSCDDLNEFLDFDVTRVLHLSYKDFYDTAFDFLYFLDVIVAVVGYVFSLRLFDTHTRSVEPTMTGWVVALICYSPFWPSTISQFYIDYNTGHYWNEWLAGWPILFDIWATLILLTIGVYVWATLSFGARFSNLTNRGIITNGPYRWTKHPAYVAKNVSYGMVALPFVSQDPGVALRATILFGLGAYIYFLRARTEERHLALDPAYRYYAAWIAQHGIFRWIRLNPPAGLDEQTLAKNSLVRRGT